MAVLGTLNIGMGVEILNTNSYRSFEACVVGAQKNRLIQMAVLSTPTNDWMWKLLIQIPISLLGHMLLVLKRTVSSRWLFWVPSLFAWTWKFRIQIPIDFSRHALLVLKRTCFGVEILNTESYLSSSASVVVSSLVVSSLVVSSRRRF